MNPALRDLANPEFEIATHTDQGARASNQDRVDYSIGKRGMILVIADGLGGHEGGELASQNIQ